MLFTIGFVRAGILQVQQGTTKLIFVCHLGGSVKTQEETIRDREGMCSL